MTLRMSILWMGFLWMGVLALAAQDPEREIVNRREEARGAYRSTPQGLYGHYCSHCHGDDAKGGGRLWATELSPAPADLTATKLDEAGLVRFVTEGSAASGRSNFCPPWGRTLERDEIERLAGQLASISGKPRRSAPPAAPAEPARKPFPWIPAAAIVAGIGALVLLLRRRKEKSDAIPQDSPVR